MCNWRNFFHRLTTNTAEYSLGKFVFVVESFRASASRSRDVVMFMASFGNLPILRHFEVAEKLLCTGVKQTTPPGIR